MKKTVCFLLSLVLSLSVLAGCAEDKKENAYKIAVVQQLEHSSLEEICGAVETRLETLAQEKGITLEVKRFNGQNDPTLLGQIGAQIAADGYDGIIPVGSLAAQCMVSATEGMEIPIIYGAVSDPKEAGLTDLPKVTGTSDALNTALIVEMMLAADPDVKTVGLLYSNSEPNSKAPIAQIKEILDSKGIAYLEKTGHTADEVMAAASALVGRVDAVFTPTDNAVMNVAPAVAELLHKNGIPHYTGADSFVAEGAFATCGVNYGELGACTADMAVDLILNGNCPPCHVMEGGIIAYNADAAQLLGLDGSVFEGMAGQVKALGTR